MLTSLILSMAMSTTPAPIIENNTLITSEISRKKEELRISRKKEELRISRKKEELRISRKKEELRI